MADRDNTSLITTRPISWLETEELLHKLRTLHCGDTCYFTGVLQGRDINVFKSVR